MVTILHYLSVRMDYNKRCRKATHLVIDETQVVSKKPGSAKQLNHAVITFRKFGGIVTMAMQNVTAALSNQTLIELFQNCSYKVFLDQCGVDAQALAAIQELSAKEYKALSAGNIGEGVMVWNKKVVLFDARISKKNVLYKAYSTNFYEENKREDKREDKREELQEGNVLNFGTQKTEESPKTSVLNCGAITKQQEALLLQIAGFLDLTAADAAECLHEPDEDCEKYLEILEHQGKLLLLENGKYRKV